MIFNSADLYTSLGATKLYGCWTSNVRKHDASSFYNWEQDNEPLYDLEERTYRLWEQGGFVPSSVNGLALVVSADAPNSQIRCNANIFQSVSAAIRVLPKVIRFPVVIEIASFGNLGTLELNNLEFEENGSLEIINRNFFKANSANDATLNSNYTIKNANSTLSPFTQYRYLGLVSAFNASQYLSSVSAVSISATVISSTSYYSDARRNTNGNAFLASPGYTGVLDSRGLILYYDRLHATIGSTSLYSTTANVLNFTDFSQVNTTEATPFDASCIDLVSQNEVIRPSNSTYPLVGMIYNNYFEEVKIKNCNGPIYIRNLFAHGQLTRNFGFDIQNSELILENCAAARFTKAGFNINSSKVVATRGMVAYRNYGVNTPGNGTTRLSGDYRDFWRDDKSHLDNAAGLKANNSHIIFSSTVTFENSVNNISSVSGKDFFLSFSRNYNGIDLQNSILEGGIVRSDTLSYLAIGIRQMGYLMTDHNVNTGLKAVNSHINFDGRIISNNNTKGMELINSRLLTDRFTVQANQTHGILADKSTITYYKNPFQTDFLVEEASTGDVVSLDFSGNGQHLVLKNSDLTSPSISGLDQKIGLFRTYDNFGLNTRNSTTSGVNLLPGILLDNSNARLLGWCSFREPTKFLLNSTEYGAMLAAINSSKVKIQSSFRRASIHLGNTVVASLARRKHIAGIYAGNKSEVEINGPFYMDGFGINLFAQDQSKITICPHRINSNELDISGFTLSNTGNHTTVELRSQRSCVVVDKSSIFEAKDLGSYPDHWTGTIGSGIIASYVPDNVVTQTSAFTYRGSLQFYPNPVETNNYEQSPLGEADSGFAGYDGSLSNYYKTTGGNTSNRNWFLTNAIFTPANNQSVSAATYGGWCIRALKNSTVNIQNVNFPCGWWIPSGIVYDVSGEIQSAPACSRLFLWNIADGSQLYASYLSVSSMYPEDTTYFGPSSVWGVGVTGGAVAYRAPSGTPDTSSLSVLDIFGLLASNALPKPGGGFTDIGYSTPKNKGPFRLLVSVDPIVNELTLSSNPFAGVNDAYGYVPQVFAQGYNFMDNLIASGSASALYAGLLKFGVGNNLATSGFYYCSAFVPPDTGSRIMLDESAANTFANAKNGAAARSGRSKICTIFKPYTGKIEGDSSNTRGFSKGLQSITNFDLDRNN